jgi:predicted nuclease of predicted toxin-antitoxin system
VLKYHFDEHVGHSIARGLRRRGVDVTTTTDAGLLGASDDEHLDFAMREQRVVFTNDDDFLIIAAAGRAHAGVMYCEADSRSIGYLIDTLTFFSDELEPDEMMNRVEYI